MTRLQVQGASKNRQFSRQLSRLPGDSKDLDVRPVAFSGPTGRALGYSASDVAGEGRGTVVPSPRADARTRCTAPAIPKISPRPSLGFGVIAPRYAAARMHGTVARAIASRPPLWVVRSGGARGTYARVMAKELTQCL